MSGPRAPGGGRRPLPTASKELRGTLRKDRQHGAEPRPRPAIPRPPRGLQSEGRREWFRMGRRLFEMGLLTELDRAALTAYCLAWGRLMDAEEKLRKHGPVVIGPGGFPIQSPYLAISNKAQEHLMRALVEFGMSPSSRTRVSALQPDAMDSACDGSFRSDPLAKFFTPDDDPFARFLPPERP